MVHSHSRRIIHLEKKPKVRSTCPAMHYHSHSFLQSSKQQAAKLLSWQALYRRVLPYQKRVSWRMNCRKFELGRKWRKMRQGRRTSLRIPSFFYYDSIFAHTQQQQQLQKSQIILYRILILSNLRIQYEKQVPDRNVIRLTLCCTAELQMAVDDESRMNVANCCVVV